MEFNSALFIVLFAVFYFFYSTQFTRPNTRVTLLFIFNTLFYFLLSKWGIVVLYGIGMLDFFLAKKIHETPSERTKNTFKIISVSVNIAAILSFNHFYNWFNLDSYLPAVLGVSFYCFRSMGYVLDVYNENIEEPEQNPFYYLTYIGFFPLIFSGPISPARAFLPQLQQSFSSSLVKLKPALFLLISGILKKYIIADYLHLNFIERVFENPHLFTGIENLMAAIAQAINVYLDFSGYTDLMMGISLLLGFEISENFNFPYLAKNITEYWRRWHLSLSAFLNENLFFPLNFRLRQLKQNGTILASFITFLISGFWHGTAWNYTFWGALHGLALAWDIKSTGWRQKWKTVIPQKLYNAGSVFLTFMFLVLSGIYFKAKNFDTAAAAPAAVENVQNTAEEAGESNVQTQYRGTQMLGKIFGDMQFKFFVPWAQKYTGVLIIILNVLIFQWFLSGYYPSIKNWFERKRFFHLTVLLFIAIFAAYQVSGLTPIPFTYLDY